MSAGGQLELHGPRGLLRDATAHSSPVSIQTCFFQTARAHVPSPGAPPRLLHPPLRDAPPWGRAAMTQRQASATAGAPRSSAVRVNCLECFSQQPIATGPKSVLLSERSTKPPQRLPHPCPQWTPHPRLMLMKRRVWCGVRGSEPGGPRTGCSNSQGSRRPP